MVFYIGFARYQAPRKIYTEEQLALAKRLRAEGANWNTVAKAVGDRSDTAIRTAIEPGYRERRNEYARTHKTWQKKNKTVKNTGFVHHTDCRAEPTDEALQERARAFDINADRSITADFCGDPRPGRSALDQKRNDYERP